MTHSDEEYSIGYIDSTNTDEKSVDLSDSTLTNVSLASIDSSAIVNSNLEDFWITANNIDWSISAKPFVDYIPGPGVIEEMCKEYPALEKAYENFKTVYAMVEQDWEGKKNG